MCKSRNETCERPCSWCTIVTTSLCDLHYQKLQVWGSVGSVETEPRCVTDLYHGMLRYITWLSWGMTSTPTKSDLDTSYGAIWLVCIYNHGTNTYKLTSCTSCIRGSLGLTNIVWHWISVYWPSYADQIIWPNNLTKRCVCMWYIWKLVHVLWCFLSQNALAKNKVHVHFGLQTITIILKCIVLVGVHSVCCNITIINSSIADSPSDVWCSSTWRGYWACWWGPSNASMGNAENPSLC